MTSKISWYVSIASIFLFFIVIAVYGHSIQAQEETFSPHNIPDMTAYISFEEGSIYDSVSGRDFVLSNISFVEGIHGQAGYFNGNNSSATYHIADNNDPKDPFNFAGGEFSLSFWLATNDMSLDISAKKQIEMISKSGSILNWGFERALDVNWQSWLRFYTKASTTLGGNTSPFNKNYQEVEYRLDKLPNPDLRDGEWHHIVVTHRPYELSYGIDEAGQSKNKEEERYYRLYIDGVLYDQELSRLQDIKMITSNPKFVLGARFQNSSQSYDRHYEGMLDEIYVFDRVITPTEVAILYGSQG